MKPILRLLGETRFLSFFLHVHAAEVALGRDCFDNVRDCEPNPQSTY